MSYISELDTQRFGFKIARIDSWKEDIESLLANLRQQGVKLVISKVSCEEIALVNQLETSGFQVKDIQLTYKFDFTQGALIPPITSQNITSKDIEIREVRPTEIPLVGAIAYDSFLEYGHYFADKRLDTKKCGLIYSDWAERCCSDPKFADKTLVAIIDKQPAGFMSFKVHSNQQETFSVLNITAVAKQFRGNGIFQLLMSNALNYYSKKVAWMESNALSINYPSNRSFSKIGFKITHSFFTLHGWIP